MSYNVVLDVTVGVTVSVFEPKSLTVRLLFLLHSRLTYVMSFFLTFFSIFSLQITSPTSFHFQLASGPSREVIMKVQELLLQCDIKNKVNEKFQSELLVAQY